ncbi:MAG: hypothetical protein Q8K59_01340 [Nitrosomonas sp.]|nr:hypothetical protein [Nitrosomonas sp.]MDP1949745.1 hypothetical protein [Nitrosomonas sp.]
MKQQKSRDNVFLNEQEDNPKVREIGQLRRAKMHASCLMEDMDHKCALNSAQRELLEAVLTLQTISILILASYLKRSPATIRDDFRRILAILKAHGRDSVLHQQKMKTFLRTSH